jgi:hypothetical protein
VKDVHSPKLSTWMFFVAIQATDNVQVFKKYSESLFPGGSGHIINFCLASY